jgi:hypothetical protein
MKYSVNFSYLLLLFSTQTSSAKTSTPLVPSTITTLRGGGGGWCCGPLERKQVAQILTAANLVNGFLNHQATETMLEAYGAKDKGPAAQVWMRIQGAASLALGVAGLSLFVTDTDIHTAMGWMATVWVAEHFRALVDRQETKIGANPTGRYIFSAITPWSAYACFMNWPFFNQFLRIYGSIVFVTFLPVAISTVSATTVMFGNHDLSDNAVACARAAAFWTMANAVFMVAIGSGIDPLTALGYALGMVLLHELTILFITKEIEKNDTPIIPIYVFTFLVLISSGCLAFP